MTLGHRDWLRIAGAAGRNGVRYRTNAALLQFFEELGMRLDAAPPKPRPYHEWHEDHGNVLWHLWPIEEAPWVGTPLDLGRAVMVSGSIQIGRDEFEFSDKHMGDTGGWPWKDADEDTLCRLYWLPLPDANALDEAIRDNIRGGPDPFKGEDQ